MEVKYFDILDRYIIKCKAYLPSSGNVTAVILGVHGFAGDKESSMLSELAKAMEAKGGALICFDLPAHGESPQCEKDLTVGNCISDLLAAAGWVENTYPTAEKFVFATSFGGYISLLSVHRLNGYRMVLRAPAVTMPKVLLESVLKVTSEQFKSMGAVECGFERRIMLPYSFYEDLIRYNPYDMTCETSMLVIHGSKDDIVPIEDVIEFCGNRKNIELVVIENADHRFKKSGEIERIVCETTRFIEAASAKENI